MINGYREIETSDYNDVAKEINRLADWHVYKAFATKFFPDAVKMEFYVEGDSDDEGGMYYRVREISAFDKDDNILDPKVYTNEEIGLVGEEPDISINRDEWLKWYRKEQEYEYHDCMSSIPVDKEDYNLVVDLLVPPTEKYKIFVKVDND